jgi:hypothetical protein
MSLPSPQNAEELLRLINLLYAEGVQRGWDHQVAVGKRRVGACIPFAVKGRNLGMINTPWRETGTALELLSGNWIHHGPQHGSDGVVLLDYFGVWCNDGNDCTVEILDKCASSDIWQVYRRGCNQDVVCAIKSGSEVPGIVHGGKLFGLLAF